MGQMYFGTKGRMAWVKCPDTGMGNNPIGWGATGQFLNGGSYVKRALSRSQTYDMSWEMSKTADVDAIMGYFDEPAPYYFLDPFATNVLPQYWAAPWLSVQNGPSLVTTATISTTVANTNGYPSKSMSVAASAGTKSLWIPVPPGYNFYFGWHGSGTGVTPLLTPDTGSAVTPAVIAVTSTTRTNTTLTNPGGVTITWQGSGASVVAGMIGVVAQTAPVAGAFIRGKGHSGCDIDLTTVQVSGYSAPSALDLQSLQATFIETGAWS